MGAVVAALELQYLLALAECAADLERVVGGLGAAADEAHLLGARHGLDDALGEFDGVGVLGEERGALHHRLGGGGDHLRVGVSQHHGAGA